MASEDAFITFGGRKVFVRVVEPDTELKYRVLVISSPMSSAAFSWRKIVPELSQLGCMTVIMDLPGFGIGGLSVSFGKVTLTSIACALILGILVNLFVSKAQED